MRAWISCKAEPDPVGSPASARRHPRTAPCQEGTAEEPGEDNADLQGGNQWPFICFTPHVRLSVPKALWKQTLLNSASGKCLRALPATRRQHVTPRQPRPWQPAGSPCPRHAQSGCAAEPSQDEPRPDGCRQGQDTQLRVEAQGHSGNLDVAVTPPGPTPKPTAGCAERKRLCQVGGLRMAPAEPHVSHGQPGAPCSGSAHSRGLCSAPGRGFAAQSGSGAAPPLLEEPAAGTHRALHRWLRHPWAVPAPRDEL